jgi:hypothetical protein
MKDIGSVWCPWEVDRVKTGYAGSIPVTSVKVPTLWGIFFVNLIEYLEDLLTNNRLKNGVRKENLL